MKVNYSHETTYPNEKGSERKRKEITYIIPFNVTIPPARNNNKGFRALSNRLMFHSSNLVIELLGEPDRGRERMEEIRGYYHILQLIPQVYDNTMKRCSGVDPYIEY